MSWIASLVLAGMIFSSETNLPATLVQTGGNYFEANKTQIVRLDETERFEQTYPLNPNGRVSVSNLNGPITVEGWDRNEVRLIAVKTATTRERLADVQIRISSRPEFLRVETECDELKNGVYNSKGDKNGYVQVEYRLTIPRGAVLNDVEAVNGSISVSNMTNVTKVSAVNGSVRAQNLRGTASLETVNGAVDADFLALQPGSRIELSSVNGRANLVIPSDANATIRAETTNGNIINDFGLPVRKGEYVGRDLYGKVGTGDVQIKLESVNADLSVRRRQDGKNPNPATNLLPQLPAVAQAEILDPSSAKAKLKHKTKVAPIPPRAVVVNVPEINAEVQRAMAEAQKEFEKTKMKIDSKEWKEAMKAQEEGFARLRENTWMAAGSPSIEKKGDTFAVKGTPKVTIDARSCSVVVKGWDRQEVQYSLTKYSRFNAHFPIDAKVDHTDAAVNIKVTSAVERGVDSPAPGVRFVGDLSRARIEVYVPKKSNLRIITNREIRIENISGELDLQGGDEAVNIRDVDGRLTVATGDGRIRLIGFQGVFDGKTADGMMSLEGEFEKLTARTVDGTIILSLPEDTNARIESNNEDIVAEGLPLESEGKVRNASVWKVGEGGGEKYLLYTSAAGKIIIRNADELHAVLP